MADSFSHDRGSFETRSRGSNAPGAAEPRGTSKILSTQCERLTSSMTLIHTGSSWALIGPIQKPLRPRPTFRRTAATNKQVWKRNHILLSSSPLRGAPAPQLIRFSGMDTSPQIRWCLGLPPWWVPVFTSISQTVSPIDTRPNISVLTLIGPTRRPPTADGGHPGRFREHIGTPR